MDHTHIVQAADLDQYSPTRESQAVIPELIYLLVKQSSPAPKVCRIPYGDAVNQPSWDGIVQIEQDFLEYVPAGVSYWEIGTGTNPQTKATIDFNKRTESLSEEERKSSAFVFVTPRSFRSGGWSKPQQTKWLDHRKDRGWKLIRIIDGVKLADWLREFPAIGQWMAKKIGLTGALGGLTTPAEHWELVLVASAPGDPNLPAKLFTEGRTNACEALHEVFKGNTNRLLMFAESPQDVADFVAGYLQTLEPSIAKRYAGRCLYISDEEAWRSVVATRSSHVLISDPRLPERMDLLALARKGGHSVVIPICGAWAGENPEIIKLRSPSQTQIEAVLREAGFSKVRAQELARIGDNRISALRRHLGGLGQLPPYATWTNARLIAQAGLAGKWDGTNSADRTTLEKLLGKDYGEWIEILRPDALRSDSPLIQRAEKWRLVARGEAWNALGNQVTDADLDRLEETAIQVLSERDPKFDLPKESRYSASLYSKALKHSGYLREGLSETLALLGSRPDALSSCTLGKAETTALLIVRKLLSGATWDRWASLDAHLPLLAEAAPDEFLDTVESALKNLSDTPFHEVFSQEGGGALGGCNYMSGLMWALETLAWSPDYLTRVSVILSDIASFDPGGNWANRPANSLTSIFLPWHFQTTAPFKKRMAAVKTILREHPDVGWKLLLALLPHSHGSTSGCHRPTWQNYIPNDWKEGVLRTEYWDQITELTGLAVGLAKENTDKLQELIDRLPDLPPSAHKSILNHLGSLEILDIPEVGRLPLWEKLEGLVRKHRRFAHAGWALPKEVVLKIENTADLLAPKAPGLKYRYLFRNEDPDLFDTEGDYHVQYQRLNAARHTAIRTILDEGALSEVLNFAHNVTAPYEVGHALGAITLDKIEGEVLPSLLKEAVDSTLGRLVAGFVWERYWKLKWNWVDDVLNRKWEVGEKSTFLTLLPFSEEVWRRVTAHLGKKNEGLYWQNVRANPYPPKINLTVAIEKLLQFGRPSDALSCITQTTRNDDRFNETLAAQALLAVLDKPESIWQLDNYNTVKVIKRLQKSESADQTELFKIEWGFLPWLDQFSSGSPVALEKKLASDPSFFAEMMNLVFRSRNDEEGLHENADKQKQYLAHNGYKLLHEWQRIPGKQDDGEFNIEAFNNWIEEALRITAESGHTEIAQIQIGHVLTYAPTDPDGLWIHEAVAKVLNQRDMGEMRSGFTTQLFNDRGVHSFTDGEEEFKLAHEHHERAEALDVKGYSRFATAMREFAEDYKRQAKHESKRNPFGD